MGVSARVKILMVIGLAVTLPLFALTWFWTQDLQARARASLEQEQANLTELVGDQVGAMVEDVQRLLETAARIPALRDGARGEVEAILGRIETAAGRLSGRHLLVVRRDGVVVGSRGPAATEGLTSVANFSAFRRAVETRAFAAGDPDPGSPLGAGLVDFWQPLVDSEGAMVRLVGLALEGRVFAGAWERLRLANGSAVVLLSRGGRVVAQTPAADGGFGRDLSQLTLWGQIQQQGSGSGLGVLSEDGVARVYGYRLIPGPSWYLAIGVPSQLAEARTRPALSWTATGVLALLVVGLALGGWWVAETLTEPLRAVAGAARRLAAGEADVPVARAGPPDLDALATDLERIRQMVVEQRAALDRLPAARPAPPEGRRGEAGAWQVGLSLFQALGAAVAGAGGEDRAAATERLLSEVLTALGMDAAALFVVDGRRRELRLLAQVGHGAPSPGTGPFPLAEGLAGRVAASGQPIVLEDAAADPRLGADAARLAGFHGFAGVPLLGGGRTLAVCELVSRARRKLAGQELKVLASVMQPLSAVLAAVHQVQAAEGRAARLEALARLTQSIASSLSTQEVFYLSVLAAAQVLDPAYVRMWEWDAAAERLRPGPWHGQADLAGEAEGADGGSEARMATLAARGGEALLIAELASDWRCPDPEWWAARGATSLAALPLRSGDRLLGVLTVVPRGATDFPPQERDLLGFLAGHMAISLENARLYQEMAAAARPGPTSQQLALAAFEAQVGRTLAAVGRAPDLRGAARALVAGAREVLGDAAVWAAVLDPSGALCLWRGDTSAPLRVPAEGDGPPSLLARAVTERATLTWSGASPCWEASVGLVARRGATAVPLVSGGEDGRVAAQGGAVGALLVGDPADAGWAPDLLAQLQRLAGEAAPILARLRDLEGAPGDREDLVPPTAVPAADFGALKDLARSAAAAPDVDRVVDVVISRLRTLPPCDAATLAFEDAEEGQVQFARDLLPSGAASPFRVPAVETSTQLAMALLEPVIIPDLHDSLLATHRRWAEGGLRSLAEVPIVAGGRTCGALVVASRTPDAFPPEQVALLSALAAAVAPGLARVRLLGGAGGGR
jgi:GAF domain-containing protein